MEKNNGVTAHLTKEGFLKKRSFRADCTDYGCTRYAPVTPAPIERNEWENDAIALRIQANGRLR